MKIKCNRSDRGTWVLLFAVLIAMVAIVVAGGVIMYRLARRVDDLNDERRRQLTNEVESFVAGALADAVNRTGDTRARAIYSIGIRTQDVEAASVVMIQWSTNLLSWGDLDGGETLRSLDDLAIQKANESNAPAAMFFRIKP